jgi:hypothetical protein
MPTFRHLTAFIGAAAVASTLGIAALVSAGAAGASTLDDAFVGALSEHGIQAPSTEEAVSLASDVCSMFDKGQSVTSAVSNVSSTTDLTEEDAAFLVGLSVGTYCPEHTAAIG